jgi:hypothetical protein
MNYPEKTIEGKLAHFKIFERGHNWLFVGEDRSRFFMWSTTPFYSVPFFKASMAIPQRAKRHYLLYKYFLVNLKPALLRTQYYDRFIPLSIPDWTLKLYLTFFDLLKRNLYQSGKAGLIDLTLGRSTKPSQEEMCHLKRLALQQLGRRDHHAFLDTTSTRQLIRRETDRKKLTILATLVLYTSSPSLSDSA